MPTKPDINHTSTRFEMTGLSAPPPTLSRRWGFRTFVVLLVLVSFGVVEIDAQSRRKRRPRRTTKPTVQRPVITNPAIALPSATTEQATSDNDVKIISTADQTDPEAAQDPAEETQPKKPKKTPSTEPDDMQQTITTLTNQVNRLNDRLTAMQEDDRYLIDMERLTRAEQRAEQLRSQLIEVQTKLADLESRLDHVEYMIKPENIDRATQGYGSVRPEEARETRRRQLENEKNRLKAQLNILETSKVRLEQSIATADNEVDLLRARLNQQRLDDALKTTPDKPTPRKPE